MATTPIPGRPKPAPMLDILVITTPLFLLIALGFVSVRSGFIDPGLLPALGAFVARVALPALLFKSLAARSLAEVMHLRFVLAYALGSLLVFGLAMLWARRVQGQGREQAVISGLGSSSSNSGYFGYPVAVQVVGPIAALALALAMLVENLLMIPLSMALAETFSQSHQPFRQAFFGSLARLRSNPLVLAMFAGFALVLLHLQLPATVTTTVGMLASASAPAALFYLGGNLVGLRPRGMLSQVGAVAAAKLLLHPLAVLGALSLIGVSDPELAAAGVLLAASPMLSIYPIVGQRHGLEVFCSAALLLTTLAAFISVGLLSWLVRSGHLFSPV